MRRRVLLALAVALAASGLSSGCVTRRVMITSDPPGAIVYRNGQPLGPTPVEEPFVYYGKYRYRLEKDGYAPLDVEPELATPWYQYPGIDLIAENVFPFVLRDTQSLHFQLQPLAAVRLDDVRGAAETLRGRGKMIGGPARPRPARVGKETPGGNALFGDAPFGSANEPPPPDPTPGNEVPVSNAANAKPDAKNKPKEKEPTGSIGFPSAPGVRLQTVTPSSAEPSR